MTRLTDGTRTAEITINEWDGSEYTPDWSNDFFEVGNLPLVWVGTIDGEAHKVEDVDYCIEQANDWASYRGDFYDPEAQVRDAARGIERCVNVGTLK